MMPNLTREDVGVTDFGQADSKEGAIIVEVL